MIYRRSTVALLLHVLVFDVSGKVRAVTNKSDRQTTNSLTLLTQHNVPMLRSVNIVTIFTSIPVRSMKKAKDRGRLKINEGNQGHP